MLIPTPKQQELLRLFGTPAKHIMGYGGSRSGKTFIKTYAVALRAAKYPNSRHAIFRKAFSHAKQTIIMDTMPKVLKIGMPELEVKLDKSDFYYTFPNGSEIWVGGLDDKERVEKILGKEFGTIYFNECSQIPYSSVLVAYTRLAQLVPNMRNLCLYDCNPPPKSHWTYKLFVQGLDPVTNMPVDAEKYAALLMNPRDNESNISPEYISEVLEKLPPRQRARFLLGEFVDDVEGALWSQSWIDSMRQIELPANIQKIVIGLDPAVTAGENSDETGIIVAAKDDRDFGYILRDDSMKASPKIWAERAVSLYHSYNANAIVAEVNQGGDMVEQTIKTIDPHVNVVKVRAVTGKMIRAEPIASLYEQGLVRHVGMFAQLEEQLTSYNGLEKSPDRMDAAVWALTHLMLDATKPLTPQVRHF